MRLADARRLAIRGQVSIRFPLSNGLECVVDRHGVARVPGLDAPPSFRLEEEFANAERFVIAPEAGVARDISRPALEEMSRAGSGGRPAAAEHEE